MSRCLVTGHKGYIGGHVYNALKSLGHEVVGIDTEDEFSGNIQEIFSNTHPKRHINHQGIANRHSPEFYKQFQPEYIFHLACLPRVGYSVEHPVETMQNNVLATSVILKFASDVGCKRVIFSSSSAVVGNGSGPTNPYGLHKKISELECKLYSELYGLDTVCLRYFNVYSPDQPADGPYATAISNYMHYIRIGKNPFITGDGEQSRDMVNVKDIVGANVFAMEYKENFNGENYDVGTGNNISLNKIKDIILQYFPEVVFDYTDERPGEVATTQGNPQPLRDLGWETKIEIVKGINECFNLLKIDKEKEI
tara:strand:+ start:225 stop:1151 length:927 start_codon:yes stop_codon:yes gene_type:complete